MKELSVIIAIYNVATYLEACLESMLHQDIEGLEVLLVNDGSTDNSQEIINQYVERYPHIFVGLQKENGGQSSARNYGLQHCTKSYVTFLDGDDYIEAGGYARILEQMQNEHTEIGLFEFVWEYPDGSRESRPALPRELSEFTPETYILSHPAVCNKIYKTSIWLENHLRFPEGIWYEDLAVAPVLVKYSTSFGYYRDEIYVYRQRPHSTTSQQKYDNRFLDIIEACDIIYESLKDMHYQDELEYLMIFQLCYFSSFRFMKFKKYTELGTCIQSLEARYPNWKQNSYYQKKPKLFRIYCELLANKHYAVASLLEKMKNRK